LPRIFDKSFLLTFHQLNTSLSAATQLPVQSRASLTWLLSVPFTLDWIFTSSFEILFSVLYRNKDTIPHAIQEISDNSGIVSDLSDIFQNSLVLVLYDAHKYPYSYLPTANWTPLLITFLTFYGTTTRFFTQINQQSLEKKEDHL